MTSDAKPKPSLPPLPPELWLDIFEFATAVNGVVQPYGDHAFSAETLFIRDHQRLLRQSLVTRRYLVRVCKQWWILASTILYRTILVGRHRGLASLSCTLMNSERGQGTLQADKPLGWNTRRIYIAIRDRAHPDGGPKLDALAALFRWLPNLAIVSFAISESQYEAVTMPKSVMEALAYHGSSLRVLEWATDRLIPARTDLLDLLTHTPNLRILNCPTVDDHLRILPFAVPTIVPSLTALSVGPIFNVIKAHLPPLRDLAFLRANDWRYDNFGVYMRSYLEYSGASVTTIFLHITDLPDTAIAESALLRYCPCLTNLTLSLNSWAQLHENYFKMPPIQYLGLRCQEKQACTIEYTLAFEFILSVARSTPSLEVVQFVDRYNVVDLRKHKTSMRRGLSMLSGCKFQLLDHEGNFLQPPGDAFTDTSLSPSSPSTA